MKTERTLISVIIPVYNAEKYILRCLSSIKSQTYDKFEVILVDDGSVDDTVRCCERFIQTDDRFRLLKNENNRGVSAARNQGLEDAVGEWVWFIDVDDWIEPMALELLTQEIDDRIDFISFDFIKERGNRKKLFSNTFKDNAVIDKKLFYENIFSCYCHFPLLWSHLFRREFLRKYHLLFNEGLSLAEDCEFMVRVGDVMTQAKVLKRGLYHYVVNMDSASQSWKPGFASNYIKSIIVLENDMRDINCSDETNRGFYSWVVNVIKVILLKDIFHPYNNEPWNERKSQAENLFEWSITQEALENACMENIKQRLVSCCIKHKVWCFFSIVSCVYYHV